MYICVGGGKCFLVDLSTVPKSEDNDLNFSVIVLCGNKSNDVPCIVMDWCPSQGVFPPCTHDRLQIHCSPDQDKRLLKMRMNDLPCKHFSCILLYEDKTFTVEQQMFYIISEFV